LSSWRPGVIHVATELQVSTVPVGITDIEELTIKRDPWRVSEMRDKESREVEGEWQRGEWRLRKWNEMSQRVHFVFFRVRLKTASFICVL
jgi:hypothetical protein